MNDGVAIHLADLLVLQRDPVMQMVVTPKLARDAVAVEGSGQFDGFALPFVVPDEQAAALITVIRKKYASHQVRCYRSNTGYGNWKRV